MRIYIIGNDGITLCRAAPVTVNDGEIAVASKEELHAAPLSGKRILALWNALPDVEKRRTVGDRGALIDRLWPAIEALPDPELEPDAKRRSNRKYLPQFEIAAPCGFGRVPERPGRFLTEEGSEVPTDYLGIILRDHVNAVGLLREIMRV